MNYRHSFHAGNFADCMKHALLIWLLRALQRKPAGIFVLDTHAGRGSYDLSSDPAERTGEWRAGIARLIDDPPPELADYISLVMDCGFESGVYPGSPSLVHALLRPVDRLACCELHAEEHRFLRSHFAKLGGTESQVATHFRDGYEAVGALLPPREKRGLILIDPPYEAPDEATHVVAALRTGYARFRQGVYAAWYPIKHRAPVRDLHASVRDSGIRDVITAELWLREPLDPARLNGCGLIVVNPPYRFEDEAPGILRALLDRLGAREPGEGIDVSRLVPESGLR